MSFFSLEAKRRGAESVVGLDLDEKLLTRARKLGEDQRLDVEFVHGDMKTLLSTADGFAASSGRPVIASGIAGLTERVMPNVNGFTFPARDSRALADLIASLAGNEQQWLKVNRTIEQPWTEFEMLEAHESA